MPTIAPVTVTFNVVPGEVVYIEIRRSGGEILAIQPIMFASASAGTVVKPKLELPWFRVLLRTDDVPKEDVDRLVRETNDAYDQLGPRTTCGACGGTGCPQCVDD
jgi:hypothetical protein